MFTPGPWEYLSEINYAGDYPFGMAHRVKIGNETLTVSCNSYGSAGEEVNRANAQLIAAAPDMYEALVALINKSHSDGAWDMAHRALAKADGGQAHV